MTGIPETRYVRSGDDGLVAYQIVGEGPHDLLLNAGIFGQLDMRWQLPSYTHVLHRLGSFTRLISINPRGFGLTDRTWSSPGTEELAEDMLAVLDVVGSPRTWLFGQAQAGVVALFFAATHPDRTSGVITFGSNAGRFERTPTPTDSTPVLKTSSARASKQACGPSTSTESPRACALARSSSTA